MDNNNCATLRQQGETAQVASAITQMASSVQEVARNAQLTASAANLANEESDRGQQRVEQNRQHLDSLASEVQQTQISAWRRSSRPAWRRREKST